MDIPHGQLDTLQADLTDLLGHCAAAAGPGDADELARLQQACAQLLEVMKRLQADADSDQAEAADVTEIGEYALRLAENLAGMLERLQPRRHHAAASGLMVNLALWIAAAGGQIDTLEPVVDALALHANTIRDPRQLEALATVFQHIINAVAPVIREDLEKYNPGRPWRVLLLNQSIVATRSHDTDLMEQAFAQLTTQLPEDAAQFFTEGMQQMDALDYPDHVRKVMQKYHRQWTLSRSLH
jgi:hypothetical protein